MAEHIRSILRWLVECLALYVHYRAEAEEQKYRQLEKISRPPDYSGEPLCQKIGACHRGPEEAMTDPRYHDGVEPGIDTP